MTPPSAVARLTVAVETLRPVLDIVEQRVVGPAPPDWCERRGWESFLLSLDDATVSRCEAEGLSRGLERAANVPPDLAALARAVGAASALPVIASAPPLLPARSLESVPTRKREQLHLLLGALGPMAARAGRVVDVGAGRGAFTRLAAALFDRRTLGIERNQDRVTTASAHRERAALQSASRAEFLAGDACRDGLDLTPGDLAVGLHACGELGDELVRTAAEIGCDAALISCCLQKISAPCRQALSLAAGDLSFSRGVLGLTNQTAQPLGVEGTLEQILSARTVCYALFLLLRARGIELEPGAAMSGINRRQARYGLRAVAQQALTLRGLGAATDREIAHHEELATVHFRAMRRLSLPRAALARLVEVTITLDRAACFEEQGFCTCVGTLFDRAVTPRNIALFASRDRVRLPSPGIGVPERSRGASEPRPDRWLDRARIA